MSNVFKNPAFYRSADGSVYNSYDGLPYAPGDTKLTQKEGKVAYREQARQTLLTMLKPGQTVYTVLKHVSKSGMSRRISMVISRDDSNLSKIDYLAAVVMDDKLSDDGGIVVSGCGMDMGFHLVYNLGSMLWPNGTPEPHGSRNGTPDSSGGYALKHQWL